MLAIFGLGHVGLVTAICLAEQGYDVIGIDSSLEKIDRLNNNELYIFEKNLEELFHKNKHKLKFSNNSQDALKAEELIICVGTPSLVDGSVDYTHILNVIDEIKDLCTKSEKIKNIIIRSTVQPGTVRNVLKPRLKGSLLNIYFYPEFLREGSAVDDFLNPNLSVIGIDNKTETLIESQILKEAKYLKKVSYETAEMIKYKSNSFHALKVAFANEVASVAKEYAVDTDDLFEIFTADEKLNISSAYLKPGFAYGGPCLTKDLKGFNDLAIKKGIDTPLMKSIATSNESHLFRFIKEIETIRPKKVLFSGVTFKTGTNDLRNSPIIDLLNLYAKKPSYSSREIHILESENVFDSVSSQLAGQKYKLIKENEKLDDDYDLVVIGSFYKAQYLKQLRESAKFINLGLIPERELEDYES